MKVKMNKKGFTLIELLAVIVVLALIMILAVPSILGSMNNAKKKTFQMYGQRLLEKALEAHESEKLLQQVTKKRYDNGANAICYTIADLGFENQGSYLGIVVVNASSLVGVTSYTLYLTDDTYAYNATSSADVQKDTSKISGTQTEIDAVKTAVGKCVLPPASSE